MQGTGLFNLDKEYRGEVWGNVEDIGEKGQLTREMGLEL